MTHDSPPAPGGASAAPAAEAGQLAMLPRRLLAPLPLFPIQPVLALIVRRISRARPQIWTRLGAHRSKTFLIDPVNLPFALVLVPDPEAPVLRAVRRNALPPWDVRIAGTVLTLLAVIDGELDSDALFFSRTLVVEGDTEAAVSLRNAIDDFEGSLAADAAAIFGPPGLAALAFLRRLRTEVSGESHASA